MKRYGFEIRTIRGITIAAKNIKEARKKLSKKLLNEKAIFYVSEEHLLSKGGVWTSWRCAECNSPVNSIRTNKNCISCNNTGYVIGEITTCLKEEKI